MTNQPFVTHCGFCGDGLLRLRRCGNCDEIVVMCDECELMWSDVADVSRDANAAADGSYPQCPACGKTIADWSVPTTVEIEERGLAAFVAGESI